VQARPISPLFAGDVLLAERDAKVKRLLTLSFAKVRDRGLWGGEFGGFKTPPPPKFRRPSKIVPNSTRL